VDQKEVSILDTNGKYIKQKEIKLLRFPEKIRKSCSSWGL